MFRKLTDKISAAANAVMGNDNEAAVQTLQSMGFSAERSRNALQTTNGDVDRAADLLLTSSSAGPATNQHQTPVPSHNNDNTNINNNNDNEAALNTALQESLQSEEARQYEAARMASKSKPSTRKATPPSSGGGMSSRAGQAAVARVAGVANPFPTSKGGGGGGAQQQQPLLASHPNVKMPAQLQHKSQEEQLLRCADRMRAFPRAVDTLFIILTAIQKDPDKDKFRKIDKNNAPSLASPGAEDMLLAMNFTSRSPTILVLSRDRVDPALLYLGISALEQTRQTSEYTQGKRMMQFEKQVKAMFSQSDASVEEAVERANYMSKAPTEPSGGRGALMQVKIADDTIRRRFDGDDTLEDVLHWLGGHASAIPNKVLSREWSLMDLNRYPLAPVDCEEDKNKTLQYIGCWPSGKMEIMPSMEGWQERKILDVKVGSSRGLGAASLK